MFCSTSKSLIFPKNAQMLCWSFAPFSYDLVWKIDQVKSAIDFSILNMTFKTLNIRKTIVSGPRFFLAFFNR